MQSWLEGRIWVGKGAQATGMTESLRIQSSKLIQTLGRASQGVDWSWSQCIKSHHALTSSGKGYQATSEPATTSEASYLGCGEKELDCCSVVQSPLFSDESNFAFHLEIKVPRVWRKSGEAQIPCCLKVQCEVSTVSDDLGCHVICWGWFHCVFWSPQSTQPSTRKFLEHCMLPSADKLYGDADFIFQQDLAPAHTAKGTKSWFQWPWCYCAWLASKLAWPEPHRESMGYCQEEDERHQTQQCQMSWRPLSKKPGLPYHLSSATN